MDIKVQNLYDKCKTILIRKKAIAIPTKTLFTKLNEVIRRWINYFRIGKMKTKLFEFGRWLRHKVRVVILKKWKKSTTIYKNLMKINLRFKNGRTDEDIYKGANSRLGLYAKASGDVINFILNPTILSYTNKKRGIIGLINPLEYYVSK